VATDRSTVTSSPTSTAASVLHPCRVHEPTFGGTWETARERANAPGSATAHDLRHYYASLLIHRGASVKTVQRRLGHRSAKTTLDTYAALWPDAEDATRAGVDDELGPRLASPSCHAL
jgi:integrase